MPDWVAEKFAEWIGAAGEPGVEIEAAEFIGEEKLLASSGRIEIGYPADDHEARQLGLPCTGAWRQMLARLIDELMIMDPEFDPIRIRLVPRGSTPATAGAADIHRK